LNPKNSKKFKKIGFLCLDSNERSNYQARELKSVNVDYECLKIKIVLHRCYINQLNTFIQVGLIAFNAMGLVTVENPLENPIIFKDKDPDNLEDQMLYDPITYKRLKALMKAKQRAIDLEDYNEAQKIKEAMDRLKAVSSQLIQLEERKQIAVKNDDFEAARIIKYEIERLRNAVAGINVDLQGFDPETVMPSYNNMMQGQLKKNFDNPNEEFNTNQGKGKVFKNNVHQDKYLENYPINSDMMMADTRFTDKTKNIDQGKKLITNPQNYEQDPDERPIKGSAQPFNVQISHDLKSNDIKNNANNENDDFDEDVGDDIPANLYKYAEPLVPYLSHDLTKLLFSNDWRKKDKGLKILIDEIKSHPHSKLLSSHAPDKIITAIMGALAHCLTSIVSTVILLTLDCIKVLYNKFHSSHIKGFYRGDLDNYTDNSLILILEKIGDSNIKLKEKAENTVLEMASSTIVGSKIVYEHLISGQIKKTLVNSARHLSARLNLINRLIENFGLNKDEVGIQALMNLAFNSYKNPNKDVRDASYSLIMSCYKFLGNEVKAYYNDLRPPQRELLEEGFDKIDLDSANDKYKDNNKIDTDNIDKRLQSGKASNKNTKPELNNNKNRNKINQIDEDNQLDHSDNRFSNQQGYEEGKLILIFF
jgi:centrosomal protein CEP104